ncbi:MAG TPA: endonuclease/exonuclease/phosphatase family protein [Candidatus Saccharimonadales bacterium]|nr:endonuclease/exonuclease/phosphatase family protein [Candidatus Saccharimonadales bacterium]
MSEITVGTWNALNAFGDETLSQERMKGAFEVVKRMGADVIALPETARRGVQSEALEKERLAEVAALMANEGYVGNVTNYTPLADERDAHYLSIWARKGVAATFAEPQDPYLLGKRNALRLLIPDLDVDVFGVHLDDRYPAERVQAANVLVQAIRPRTEFDSRATIALGDFNDMHAKDPKGRMPRLMGRFISGIEVRDYYDESKRVQRLAGKVIRVCRMAGGASLQVLTEAGFHDADRKRQPTIGSGRMAFQLDHILGSPGISFEDFKIHRRSPNRSGPPLSDHFPITARAIRM